MGRQLALSWAAVLCNGYLMNRKQQHLLSHTVPDGTQRYAVVLDSRITFRVPSPEIRVFLTASCVFFAVPERALEHVLLMDVNSDSEM